MPFLYLRPWFWIATIAVLKMLCFPAPQLHGMARCLLEAAGTPRHIADEVAQVLVNANLCGHDSHGVLRIPIYLRTISEGDLEPAAEPEVAKETPNVVVYEKNKGFGHYGARKAMDRAIQKAKRSDVCSVSLPHLYHIGRLGEYAETAAAAGCIGLITLGGGIGNAGHILPYGGKKGALGTNPLAAGVPTGDGPPFILDFATSIIAEGKIKVARSKNADLPEGCIVDKQGMPSVKTADFYDGGFLLPFGGHKGYGISLLVSLLSALSGNFDVEKGQIDYRCTFMQVINVEAFLPLETYQRGVRSFLDGIKSTPPAEGFGEVLVHGDLEDRTRRERLISGIELPESIVAELTECATQLGVSLDENVVEPSDVERYRLEEKRSA